ncbi:MAG: M23 family metallopeptidase [Phycicoccus sp.]
MKALRTALIAGPMIGGTALIAGVAILGGVTTATTATIDHQQQEPQIRDASLDGCAGPVAGGPVVQLAGVTKDQSSHIGTIWRVARSINGIGDPGAVVGIATAAQESGWRNLTYGDRDSLGLFQQRAAWGPAADRTDPTKSATMFYRGGAAGQRGLEDIPGWKLMPVWEAAQAVQVSAFPTAYRRWEPQARAFVAELSGAAPPGPSTSSCDVPGVTSDWTQPIAKGDYAVTSEFGPRPSPGGVGSTNHQGIDFAAPIGTPVVAAAAGKVTAVRSEAQSGGFGNLLIIDHGSSIETYYAHLDSTSVQVGQQVKVGERIGACGNTGNSTGPHLHFQVNRGGTPINPRPWLTDHGAAP